MSPPPIPAAALREASRMEGLARPRVNETIKSLERQGVITIDEHDLVRRSSPSGFSFQP